MRNYRNLLSVFAFLSCSFPVAPTAGAEALEPQRGTPYFTLRNRTGDEEPGAFYGDERDALKAGHCQIRERRLDMLSPFAEAASFYIPEEILRVDAIREAPLEEVLDRLQVSSSGRAPVLYTHGFYVDFEKGCRRATILQENAELQDRFLWFSWPSDGALLNYTHDEADLYWSVPDLANVIADMEARFGAGEVNLVGHSLGGRGIVLALYDVAARHSDARIGDVVLLAPDIDFDFFRKLLPQIRPIVRSITIYVAAADRPLALSARLHGYPRLGEVGNDIARLSGVEVIDLSDLPVASPTGHLYHLYNAEIGHDLKQLLIEGKFASERSNLVQVGDNLWKLRPVK